MNKLYVIMTLNGFCEPIRVIEAPIFQTIEQAENYINQSYYKDFYWIESKED